MALALHPSCGCRLGKSALIVVRGFSCVVVGGCRGSGSGWWLCIEAAASGCMVGRSLIRSSDCLRGLGDILMSLVRQGCWLGRRASEEAV
jgi:hypothetical protein